MAGGPLTSITGVKQCMQEPIELIRSIRKAKNVNILDRKIGFVRFFIRIKIVLTIVARYMKRDAINARCKGLGIKKKARLMSVIPIIIYKPIETRITRTGGSYVFLLNKMMV